MDLDKKTLRVLKNVFNVFKDRKSRYKKLKLLLKDLLLEKPSTFEVLKGYLKASRFITQAQLTQLSYNTLKFQKKKILSTINFLVKTKKEGLSKVKNKQKEVIYLNYSSKSLYVKNAVLRIKDIIYVGKSAFANQRVYKMTKGKEYIWYHAHVKGGSLVALKKTYEGSFYQDLAVRLALFFSKYYSKNGPGVGVVFKSKKIINTSMIGSFIFEEKKLVRSNFYLKLYFKIFTMARKLKIGFKPFSKSKNGQDLRFSAELKRSDQPSFKEFNFILNERNFYLKAPNCLNFLVPTKWSLFKFSIG